MLIRRLFGGAAAAAVALGVTVTLAPSASAGVEDLKARISRHEDGNWKSIITGIDLPPGDNKKLFLKVKSRTGDSEEALLRQPFESFSYATKYHKKGVNITDEVNTFSGGYPFTAKPDKYKRFEVKLIKVGASGPQCIRQVWVLDDESAFDTTTIGADGGLCS